MDQLNREIIACELCPRLRLWCTQVAIEKRAAFADQNYWGKPVPNFGDPDAQLLIVGLAPAAHGANRTGRMFTGDRSGEWLYRAMNAVGLASQNSFENADDGLVLSKVLITAVNHCAPPDNKPLPSEIENCRPFLSQLLLSRSWKGILCLGGIAWNQVHRNLAVRPLPKFGHGVRTNHPVPIHGCYHPSQQNTFTGRLTQAMLEAELRAFKELLLPSR